MDSKKSSAIDDIEELLDAVPLPEPKEKKRVNTIATKAKIAAKRKERLAREKLKKIVNKEEYAKKQLRKEINTVKEVEHALSGHKTTVIEAEKLIEMPPKVREYASTREIIFAPNPGPQTEFLAASEKEVFYGGARGGGKSYSLIVDPLRDCHSVHHKALIIRRTMPELRDLIDHAHHLYNKAYPGTRWKAQESLFLFPSGAKIEFGYGENKQDLLRYQGRGYTWIGVDELPQYPDSSILNALRGSLRTGSDIPTYMRFTGNPGNVGSAWVKEMFIDPAPPNTAFKVKVSTPQGDKFFTRRFIPAKLQDNPHLMKNDDYLVMLSSLPEIQRRQWLEGDWDAWDGAAFPDFRRDIHVIEPFQVPSSWLRFRACDWGYSSAACCLWFAVDYDNNLYVYRELHTKLLTADVFAQRVKQLEAGERVIYGVMDASVWARRGDVGPGIVEVMSKAGVQWRPSDRSPQSRKNGKLEVHRRLALKPSAIDGQLKPSLFIFPNCVNLIRDLPTLPLDENDPEDVDTDANDHSYDALRYGCMSRPLSPMHMEWATMQIQKERYAPTDSVFGY